MGDRRRAGDSALDVGAPREPLRDGAGLPLQLDGPADPRRVPHLSRGDGSPGAAMKFGLNFFPSFRPSDLSTAAYFDQVLRMCERADQLGYHSVKAVEHYFHDYGGQTPNPIVLLSAIVARTRRIRPITGAVIPAFNHPVKLAGELAMLDNISGGPPDAGFGRGSIPKEFDAFAVPM